MNPEIITDYIDKVYGYAVNHTYSREEADELSQEILFTAVKKLPTLRDGDRFEAWLWGLASNVTKAFRRTMGKQRAMYSYDILDFAELEDTESEDNEELYASLRREISKLSAIYRDIVILYYYDGLSTKEISDRLGIPEGTVTWRLSEARKKLKKEYTNMNESALRPVKMHLSIYGNGNYHEGGMPFPTVYIDDALSQNILFYCYEEAKTVEELADLCGVPAFYIEDRIGNLLNRCALIEQGHGKYRTNFIIFSDKYSIYHEENVEAIFSPLADRMLDALEALTDEAEGLPIYKAENVPGGRSREDRMYLYGAIAFRHLSKCFCELPWPEITPNYDGFCWRYMGNMESGKHHSFNVGFQCTGNQGSRGCYSHTIYRFGGFGFRSRMLKDYCVNVCEDIIVRGSTEDTESAAEAICDGYVVKGTDGRLLVNIPAFTKEQLTEFNAMAEKHFAPLMPEYSAAVNRFALGYKKLTPKHLGEEIERLTHRLFWNMYEYFVVYGQRNGRLPAPSGFCDVLIQFK